MFLSQGCGIPESICPFLRKVVIVGTKDKLVKLRMRKLEHQAGTHALVQLKVFLQQKYLLNISL